MHVSSMALSACAVYSALGWTDATCTMISPAPPAARARWYSTSRSPMSPSSPITVSWPDEKIRLRISSGPRRSGENNRGNGVEPG